MEFRARTSCGTIRNSMRRYGMKTILFVCTGNTCRSQMAHGFLQSVDPRLEVYSAGTEAAGALNQRAVAVMKEAGCDISHHTSDSIDMYLDQNWDMSSPCVTVPTKSARCFLVKSKTGCTWASTTPGMPKAARNLS